MSADGAVLWAILVELGNPNISLKEVKGKYFEAKELLNSIVPDDNDIEASIRIYNEGNKIVGEFFEKWKIKKEISPTNEELDLLEEAFDEASSTLNNLATKFPSLWSVDDNEITQKKLKENKWVVLKEKFKREEKQENPNGSKNNSESYFPWIVATFFFLTSIILFVAYKRKRN